MLADRWLEDKGNDGWEAARAACARALETRSNAEGARASFITAAEKSNIRVKADV
ncbi:DUF982 domain-containing protein [Rhizobium sp. 42MFCr.1]|uniref:DUF982 domain-containing protein n=1 Tax=Rhizobium sp. 42MFCr.1 TaxID=1048680 RepID=UPI002FFB2268